MFEGTGLLELAWEDGQIVMRGQSPPPPPPPPPPPAKRPRTSRFFDLNPGLDKPGNSNMNQAGSSHDKASGLKNFSLFLKPELLVKGYGGTRFDTGSTLVGPSSLTLEELKPSKPGFRSGLVESSMVLSSRRPNFHHVLNNTERVETPLAEPPPDPDEESKAFSDGNGKRGGQGDEGLKPSSTPYCTEKLPVGHQLGWTSSACSRGDSNDVALSLRHRHEQNEEIAYASENDEEESASLAKLGDKRKRRALGHNASEKKRRGRINKRLKELQHLLPNSNKVDKASMLDDAITHIKTLQLQLQMMSMGQGLYNYMPQIMLQNGAMRHTQLNPLMGLAFVPNLPPGSTMDQLVSASMFIGSKDQTHQNLHPRTS